MVSSRAGGGNLARANFGTCVFRRIILRVTGTSLKLLKFIVFDSVEAVGVATSAESTTLIL